MNTRGAPTTIPHPPTECPMRHEFAWTHNRRALVHASDPSVQRGTSLTCAVCSTHVSVRRSLEIPGRRHVRPHFVAKKEGYKRCGAAISAETRQHILAKAIILHRLHDLVVGLQVCAVCDAARTIRLDHTAYSARLEAVDGPDFIFDVLVLHSGEPVGVIEIYHTHRTELHKVRAIAARGLWYAEFVATGVMQLDEETVMGEAISPTNVALKDPFGATCDACTNARWWATEWAPWQTLEATLAHGHAEYRRAVAERSRAERRRKAEDVQQQWAAHRLEWAPWQTIEATLAAGYANYTQLLAEHMRAERLRKAEHAQQQWAARRLEAAVARHGSKERAETFEALAQYTQERARGREAAKAILIKTKPWVQYERGFRKCVICSRWRDRDDLAEIHRDEEVMPYDEFDELEDTLPFKIRRDTGRFVYACSNHCSVYCESCHDALPTSNAAIYGLCMKCNVQARNLRIEYDESDPAARQKDGTVHMTQTTITTCAPRTNNERHQAAQDAAADGTTTKAKTPASITHTINTLAPEPTAKKRRTEKGITLKYLNENSAMRNQPKISAFFQRRH